MQLQIALRLRVMSCLGWPSAGWSGVPSKADHQCHQMSGRAQGQQPKPALRWCRRRAEIVAQWIIR